jgi:hypothetical protein
MVIYYVGLGLTLVYAITSACCIYFSTKATNLLDRPCVWSITGETVVPLAEVDNGGSTVYLIRREPNAQGIPTTILAFREELTPVEDK